jgi:hypothetical protein
MKKISRKPGITRERATTLVREVKKAAKKKPTKKKAAKNYKLKKAVKKEAKAKRAPKLKKVAKKKTTRTPASWQEGGREWRRILGHFGQSA